MRAARRAGQAAASTPTPIAPSTNRAIRDHGDRRAERYVAQVDATHRQDAHRDAEADPEQGPEQRDQCRLQPDQVAHPAGVQADRAQQADLAGAFEHGHRKRVERCR